MAMVRLVALLSGQVQAVGMRETIRMLAAARGVPGRVENLPDGRVRLIAEGDRKALEEILSLSGTASKIGRVDEIAAEWSAPTHEFSGFEVIRGDLVEELSETVRGGMLGFSWLGEKVDAVGVKVDAVGVKVDAVGAKVDAVGAKVDAVGAKVDVVGVKVDGVAQKLDAVAAKIDSVDATTGAVLSEVRGLRGETSAKGSAGSSGRWRRTA